MKIVNKFGLVWLAITYACNNKCIWCYADTKCQNKFADHLNIKYLNSIIRLLCELNINRVALIGGEPTLHPNLSEIINCLSNNHISVHIITNGRRFSDRRFVDILKLNGLKHSGFSIEGSNSSIHDSITQVKGSFNECIQGIKNSCDSGIQTYTNTTISQQNINDLVKIIDLVSQFNIRSINFNICGPCLSQEHSFSLSPKKAAEAYLRVFKHAKKIGIKTKLLTATPLCNFDISVREELKENRIIHGGPCQLTHGRNFVIDYNGNILPCTHLTEYPMFNIFNTEYKVIGSQEFISIYNDKNKLPVKFRVGMNRYASDKCERKNCKENCSGGCPLFWTKFNPDLNIIGI